VTPGAWALAPRHLEGAVDIAVVDLGLPDGYGGDLISDLRDVNPRAHALVLTRPGVPTLEPPGAAPSATDSR
jgi:DNA-binding NarL/FixJ family response regulator